MEIENKTKLIKIIHKKNNDEDNYEDNHENNKIIFEKIFNISNEILNKINDLELRITNIEQKLNIVLVNNDIITENLKELKKENLDVEKTEVLKALNYRDYRSIIYIFRYCYKNKLNEKYLYPIRITGKRSFEYYDNNKWNPDLYGYHSMNIIFYNIQNLFIKYNDLDNIDAENFLLNQNFINNLSDDKHKKNIFKNVIEEVRINNI